jgi:2-desacetyl-2-hydroxyethyl bacteriochlorophyllide A dehydrogenase
VPRATIVIRAFNEALHLPRLLDGIAAQTEQDIETVLVDSGSLDDTVAIATSRCDRVVEIDSHDFTFGYSLNRGCAAATGEYLVIVSAHTYPAHERWLELLLRNFDAEEGVALVYGNQLPVDSTKPSERYEFEQLFGPRRRVQRAPDYYCNNANAAILRALWEAQPYDETLTGMEDVGWAKHWLDRGWVLVYEPEAPIHHVHDETWAQIERRYYREAFARRRLRVDRRRHIPRHVAAGARQLARDVTALQRGQRLDRATLGSVARYRYRQTKGTLRGLVHDYQPAEHQELYFDRSNEAVVIREPGKAALELVPLPDVKPNDVLIEIAYVGICATDLEVLEGSLEYYRSGWARYPIVPGHEYSGVVVRKGANVGSELAVGDRVVGACILGCSRCAACESGNPISCGRRREVGVLNHDGAYARFLSIPSQYVHTLPADADLRAHVLVEPLAVVQKGLGRVAAFDGSLRAAVVGAGPIGNLAAQTLALGGHDVAVYDRDQARLDLLPPAVTRRERELSDFGDFELVVEATGSTEALRSVLDGVGTGARVLLLGLPYGDLDIDFERLVAFDRSVVGSVGSGPEEFRRAIELLPKLSVDALTATTLPLERFEDAWRIQRERGALKVILEVSPPDGA